MTDLPTNQIIAAAYVTVAARFLNLQNEYRKCAAKLRIDAGNHRTASAAWRRAANTYDRSQRMYKSQIAHAKRDAALARKLELDAKAYESTADAATK